MDVYAAAINRPQSAELAAARALLPVPQGRSFPVRTLDEDGYTSDIVAAMLALFRRSWRDVAQVAPLLRQATDELTLRAVWQFARKQITYVLDRPPGTQYIKTPRAVLWTGIADCKGLAILQNALLLALGFAPEFKFAGYAPGGQFTHVYSQVSVAGRRYTLDACLPEFNQEKTPAVAQLEPAPRD